MHAPLRLLRLLDGSVHDCHTTRSFGPVEGMPIFFQLLVRLEGLEDPQTESTVAGNFRHAHKVSSYHGNYAACHASLNPNCRNPATSCSVGSQGSAPGDPLHLALASDPLPHGLHSTPNYVILYSIIFWYITLYDYVMLHKLYIIPL